MPIMGLGTWQSTPEEIDTALDAALEAGYRHIDTAFMYFNETSIGNALKRWFDSGKLNREDVFITTKLPIYGNRPQDVPKFVDRSLRALQLDYLDCYLIHGPIGVNMPEDEKDLFPMKDGKLDIDMTTDLVGIWNAMEDEVDAGRIRTIGVSNFNEEQIRRLNLGARKYKVAVNQVELHAEFQQKAMRKFCSRHRIVIMAYGPLGSPGRNPALGGNPPPSLLENPIVTKIAERHSVTPAQVLLHHIAQKGIAVIPKSVTPHRIQSNREIFHFTLSPAEYRALDGLDKGPEGRSFSMERIPGVKDHPEFPLKE
ncbi:unnamed protein product [Cyprideis torosa]|uniref:Uncharacterized protein n=1 Tax=Cyprideis torosa TaxID=163714 RepID=A0A7R8W0V8_9CRUS|nr:unnamed protein product [Cyprideis torosa]CAG0880029.1 unnamed protein product [Cyprideis torosa]